MNDGFRGNMVGSPSTGVTFERVAEAPESFRELAYAAADDTVEGKLVE